MVIADSGWTYSFYGSYSRNPRQLPELESYLGYWLRRVSNTASGALSRTLQERQTSAAEWVLPRELQERKQASPGELANALELPRGAVSKIIDKRKAKDWVQSDAKQGDNRYRLLPPTRAGRRSIPILAAIAAQNDASYFDSLTAREKTALRELPFTPAEHHRIHDIPTG